MLSKNTKETEKIAKIFLEKILKSKRGRVGALVVGLSGDLGAGKTAFTQSIAKHLGIKNKITSPTFVILKSYPIPEQARYGAGKLKAENYQQFFHIDAYRLKNEKELLHLGWEEIISKKDHLVFVEWPENVSKIIPKDAKFIYFSHGKNNSRNLKLK